MPHATAQQRQGEEAREGMPSQQSFVVLQPIAKCRRTAVQKRESLGRILEQRRRQASVVHWLRHGEERPGLVSPPSRTSIVSGRSDQQHPGRLEGLGLEGGEAAAQARGIPGSEKNDCRQPQRRLGRLGRIPGKGMEMIR